VKETGAAPLRKCMGTGKKTWLSERETCTKEERLQALSGRVYSPR